MENMNNQGKRPDQIDFSNNMAMGAIGGVIGILIFCLIIVLFAGCATTNETPKKPCCKTEKKC